MKNNIYIIPGLGENCNLIRYKKLKKILEKIGYVVICKNPDWYRPLSEQIFPVKKNEIIIGFSFGAVIAYLIAKKYPCKKAIFASLSPIHKLSFKNLEKEYKKDMTPKLGPKLAKIRAAEIAKDIKNIKISLNMLKMPFVTLVGEKEKSFFTETHVDFIIPNTHHKMTNSYIRCIKKLLF